MSKLQRLKNYLKKLDSAVIAFSGGVDSTFLLELGRQVLGDKLIAVTVSSQLIPEWEIDSARKIAQKLGVRHLIIEVEIKNRRFLKNGTDRCYWCKRTIFHHIKKLSQRLGSNAVIEATNKDDLKDWRPGIKALEELKIKSPFLELGFTKLEIRKISKKLGLPNWDKPSSPCLATRIPYGIKISSQKLTRIARAEKILIAKGFKVVRVRDYDLLARIEVDKTQIFDFLNPEIRKNVISRFKKLGYKYITLDLEGYRSGSMNIPEVSRDE